MAINRNYDGHFLYVLFLLKVFRSLQLIDIPWILAIFGMVSETKVPHSGLNSLEAVIYWFASPRRILYHALSRVVRALIRPLVRVAIGILIKRAFGLNSADNVISTSQKVLLRRYLNGILLSQEALKEAFSILGTHYEVVSVSFYYLFATTFCNLLKRPNFRLSIEQWVPKLAGTSTGLAPGFTAPILNCSKSETMLSLDLAPP
jgi:hypothetical protein